MNTDEVLWPKVFQVEHRQKMPDSDMLLGRPESELHPQRGFHGRLPVTFGKTWRDQFWLRRDREKELLKQQLFEKLKS